jgi:hypothetical protein
MLIDLTDIKEIIDYYNFLKTNKQSIVLMDCIEDLLKKKNSIINTSLEDDLLNLKYKEIIFLYKNILNELNFYTEKNYLKINNKLNIFYDLIEYMLLMEENYIKNINNSFTNNNNFKNYINLKYFINLEINKYFMKYLYDFNLNNHYFINNDLTKKSSNFKNLNNSDIILLLIKKLFFKNYSLKKNNIFFVYYQMNFLNILDYFFSFTKKIIFIFYFRNSTNLDKNFLLIKQNLYFHDIFTKKNSNYNNLINKQKNIYIKSNLFFINKINKNNFIDFNDILYYNLNKKNLFYENIQDMEIQKNLSKIHFEMYFYLYSAENNIKILLNSFLKQNNLIKNNYILTLPINYEKSKILNHIVYNLQSFSIDFFFNNLRFDNILYNPAGFNLETSYIFLKKNYTTPLFYNYKLFNNFFDYILNNYYNSNIISINKNNYNLDFFRINKKKKIRSFLHSEYYSNFLRLQNFDYTFVSEIYIRDFRPHLIHKIRPIFLDFFKILFLLNIDYIID